MGKKARFGPELRGRNRVSEGRAILSHKGRDNSMLMADNSEKYRGRKAGLALAESPVSDGYAGKNEQLFKFDVGFS